jgi:hypothetical protein
MTQLLGDDRWNFRFAAPANLLPLMRAFHGLLYYLGKMAAPIDFHAVLSEVGRFDPPRPINQKRQGGFPTERGQAQSLKIRVERNGETTVQLSFPADAAERLASLLDDDLSAKIALQRIDISAISRSEQVRQRVSGRLFFLEDGARTIEVSLV